MRLIVILTLLVPLPGFADQEPEGRAAFIAASAAYHRKAYDDSIEGYRKTIDLHHEVPFSKMMIARLWALKGDIERGITALDEAAEFEFPGAQLLQTDPEFESLRAHPRYAEIFGKVRNNALPCRQRPIRRQFDFFLGDWDITAANGRVIGRDHVELNEDSCVLKETFIALDGNTGQSLTFYERSTGLWRQVWMDPGGIGQNLAGEFVDGKLVLTQTNYNGGLKSIVRVTYSKAENGAIRQLTERSTDEGETWATASNLLFTPRPQ